MLKNPFKKSSLNKYQNLINQINTLESELVLLNDSDLRAKSLKLQEQHKENPNLDSLIAESFALTRETSQRTLGLRHYDVQLAGGLVLNDQKIAEMKTGEGKTLVATLPAVLNALTKKGVHIVTVNDYLDRKSTRLNSSHQIISYAVFCLKKKKKQHTVKNCQPTSRSINQTPT